MAFDGLVNNSIVKELNNKLIGAKVNKIYEPNKNEITLDLYAFGINNRIECIDKLKKESIRWILQTALGSSIS